MLVLSESQMQRVRKTLAQAVATRCQGQPERLTPWLSDSRWYVVRNTVHILGWIGGPDIVRLLPPVVRHPEPRVRAEVVDALAEVDLTLARPLLLRALEGADTVNLCRILKRLSGARDVATARIVFAYLEQDGFHERPVVERRAIYAAIASCGGDEQVPALESALLQVNWFDRGFEVHRQAVAQCLGCIGTPRAQEVLRRAAASSRADIRRAAQAGLTQLPTP